MLQRYPIILFLLIIVPLAVRCQDIKTTWDSLRFVELPALSNDPASRIRLYITQVPPGAVAHVNTLSACGAQCRWDCDVSEEGAMLINIINAYGYGPKFEPCQGLLELEFMVKSTAGVRPHHTLLLALAGDRRLPTCRIGEVAVRMDASDGDTLVYLYPQLDFDFPSAPFLLNMKPQFEVTISGTSYGSVVLHGWPDCSGLLVNSSTARSPCKPNPIPMDLLREDGGIVTVSFTTSILFYGPGMLKEEFQFEGGNNTFRYDVLNGKLVER